MALRHSEGPSGWPQGLPEQSRLSECHHEPHQGPRRKTIMALDESAYRSDRHAAARMATCCNAVRFYIDPDAGKVAMWTNRCGHRLCPFCARLRSAHTAADMLPIVKAMKRPSILVLTVKSSDRPLANQIGDLRDWFRKLRQRKLWTDRVAGGVYTVEVTINEKTGQWHPHLHVIIDAAFLPYRKLTRAWEDITRKSRVVWIEEVKDRHGAVIELCKYIGKPQRIADWTARQIRSYAQATRAARLVQTFGNTHGLNVHDDDPSPPKPPDEYSVSLQRLVFLARHGNPTPQRLVETIAERWPHTANYIYHELPQLAPEPTDVEKALRRRALVEGRAPPPRAPPQTPDQVDALDARLFIQFTRYRQEQTAGQYDNTDWRGQSDLEQ